MTRSQIKTNVRENLSDTPSVRFTEDDLNESFQDAYDDIAILTQCFSKSVTLFWEGGRIYYDFKQLGVSDYLGTVAIFNNVTNMWLRDDLHIRNFDQLRRDWETWNGSPQFWAPVSPSKVAIAAHYPNTATDGAFSYLAFSSAFFINSSVGTFNLLYYTIAPLVTSDSYVPLIASDVQTLFENYMTADMLEQDEQYVKAADYWDKYYEGIDEYALRVKKINQNDLLLRV